MESGLPARWSADSNIVWKVALAGLGGVFFASPEGADGKVYFVSETGETIVVRAGRKPEILARNNLRERLIASTAISGRSIFLRSDENLFCLGRSTSGHHKRKK